MVNWNISVAANELDDISREEHIFCAATMVRNVKVLISAKVIPSRVFYLPSLENLAQFAHLIIFKLKFPG